MVFSLSYQYKIIFNPIAGKGAAEKRLPHVISFLKEKKIDFEIFHTQSVGHAITLARDFASLENCVIVAAGGDGTCNEVINGLMEGKGERIPLFAVLPMGRGNDFSYGGRIPAELDDALSILIKGNTSPLDVGLIVGGDYPQGRYFGNGIGIGFDTVVGLEAAKMNHVHDTLAYVLGALRTLIKFTQSPLVDISYGSKKRTLRTIQISLMNGRRMGGLFYMTPEAENDDGMLDLCMVEQQTRFRLVRLIVAYIKGTQKGMKGVTMDRSEKISYYSYGWGD
jgi:diacylglycerol kinase (ATP)